MQENQESKNVFSKNVVSKDSRNLNQSPDSLGSETGGVFRSPCLSNFLAAQGGKTGICWYIQFNMSARSGEQRADQTNIKGFSWRALRHLYPTTWSRARVCVCEFAPRQIYVIALATHFPKRIAIRLLMAWFLSRWWRCDIARTSESWKRSLFALHAKF